ncbi:DUF6427 family protein [Marinirhabdus gelatinilytica]|uniref:Beta-carotene 15,15'-monooxygenase n=1 Tax=Marinirhabdus gelatinilytica TaxID=1703343 RepID=A0A370QJL1_9FLAO|nr:DUF6427 family protein [Marinirhabdus gelatinilytica]RDK88534.1 hypothetical protein C8D94_101408 [Marinirhabdus gelatinilytica]
MLTNFFGKSSPINFIICGVYLLFAVFPSFFIEIPDVLTFQEILTKGGFWLVLVFAMLLLDFIIRKNNLTGHNTFGVFIFSGLVAMLPVVFTSANIIFANVFLLLALRRMASLTSEKNIEKKIFDASFYITIAMLFQFWSVLFFAPLYWVISRSNVASFRMLFIPLAGVFAVLILWVTAHLLMFDSVTWFLDWIPPLQFDFGTYNKANVLLPVAFIATLLVWTMVLRVLKFSSMPKKLQQNYRLITFVVITSMAMLFLGPIKTGAELLFLYAPLSIVATNYIERLKDILFKEMLLWAFVLLPIALLFV